MATTKTKTRSPAYPSIDLPEALQRAESIRKAEGKNPTNVDTAIAHWGHKPKSGAGMAALSALIKFGLLDDEGKGDERRVYLTSLAMKILLDDRPSSAERLAAVREAALMPSIHLELWKKYQGALPSDSTLRYYLRHDRNFQDGAVNSLVKEFRATLAYAQLSQSASISPDLEDTSQPEGELEMPPPPTIPPDAPPKGPEGGTPVMRTLQIPFTEAPWAMIQVPYPLSERDWDELMSWLDSNSSPLTKGAVKPKRT